VYQIKLMCFIKSQML